MLNCADCICVSCPERLGVHKEAKGTWAFTEKNCRFCSELCQGGPTTACSSRPEIKSIEEMIRDAMAKEADSK